MPSSMNEHVMSIYASTRYCWNDLRTRWSHIYTPFCFRRPSTTCSRLPLCPAFFGVDLSHPQASCSPRCFLVPPPLSRSASTSSVVSASASEGGSKRTRKRFSQEQVIVLEKMFQKTSHPSKGEREAVAKQTGMCVFSSSFSPPFSPLGRLNPTNQLVRNTGTSSQ